MTSDTRPEPQGHVHLTWDAPLHIHHHRTWVWYVITGALVLGCLVSALMTANWLFAGVIILLVALYAWVHRHEPTSKTITIRDDGIGIDQVTIPWDECECFWILQSPDFKEVRVERKGSWIADVTIQLNSIEPRAVQAVFQEFLPECSGRNERLLDYIIRICKL